MNAGNILSKCSTGPLQRGNERSSPFPDLPDTADLLRQGGGCH